MATLEGALVRKWRKALGDVAQEALAEACPIPLSKQRIGNIERELNSVSVANLLNVIKGLERVGGIRLGSSDRARLCAFFAGPDADEAERLHAAAGRRVRAALIEAGIAVPRR